MPIRKQSTYQQQRLHEILKGLVHGNVQTVDKFTGAKANAVSLSNVVLHVFKSNVKRNK